MSFEIDLKLCNKHQRARGARVVIQLPRTQIGMVLQKSTSISNASYCRHILR